MPDEFQLDGAGIYRAAALQSLAWLDHGFGTAAAGEWADSARLARVKQVHSNRVVVANGQAGIIGEGDALITNEPGRYVGVRSADCVPVLLADVRGRAVAAIHSGWRGTAANICACTISELVSRFGTQPGDVVAAIGPAIGACCYEVGPEVANALSPWNPGLIATKGHTRVDLIGTIGAQLQAAGVPPRQIFRLDRCTCCTPGWESFRRDGDRSGRMLAAIGVL